MAAARLRGREPGVIMLAAAAAAAVRTDQEAGFVAAAAAASACCCCRRCLADAVAEDGGALKRLPAPKAVAEGEGSVVAVFVVGERRGGGGKKL